jgi:hypothetical protein
MKKIKKQESITIEKKLKQYIDNDKFLVAMKEWKKQIELAKKSKSVKPPITEYIGECFLKIAEHLSYRPNFMNYPFREEMIGDGVENCILYAHNFNPRKSKNPFSYFTQIIYYAFLRRIEKEKKQAYVKYQYMKLNDEDGELTRWIKEKDFEEYNSDYKKFDILSDEEIEKLENKKVKSPKKKKTKKLKRKYFE